jgi:type IV pilus assembly protein PilX
VLIASLLLLVVMTLIAVAMFRGTGLGERIAGGVREKHRALQAAESAEEYAEWWLTNGSNSNNVTNCTALLNANAGQGTVCANQLPNVIGGGNVANVPWTANGVELGTRYTPPAMTVNTNLLGAPAQNTFWSPPRFYIDLVGPAAGGQGTVYRIHAWGYGSTPETVAVVESTYAVNTGVRDLGAP